MQSLLSLFFFFFGNSADFLPLYPTLIIRQGEESEADFGLGLPVAVQD